MKIRLLLAFLFFSISISAQNGVQTVKGQIIDQQSELPLIGATIQLLSSTQTIGTSSDFDGFFSIPNVPLGRQEFSVEYLGYEAMIVPNVQVTAKNGRNLNRSRGSSYNCRSS